MQRQNFCMQRFYATGNASRRAKQTMKTDRGANAFKPRARHIHGAQTAKAKTDRANAVAIHLRMMLQCVQGTLGARQQHGAVIHKWLHERVIFLRGISALALAIHINRETHIAKRRQFFRLHARKIILTGPRVKNQHSRTPRCHGAVKSRVALIFHLRIGVRNKFCLHLFHINARKKATHFKYAPLQRYVAHGSRTSRARGA